MGDMTTYPIRRMTPKDIPAILELVGKLGWSHQRTDWERFIAWGGTGAYCIQNPYGRNIISTAIAFQYGATRGWLGAIITDPNYQGRGFGRRMTQTVIDHLAQRGVQEIMLDASEMGELLYSRMDFRPLYQMFTYTGTIREDIAPPPAHIRPMTPEDLPAVIALDAASFGAARPAILERIFQNGQGWIDGPPDAIRGFVLALRKAGNHAHIGPWIHPELDGATALWATATHALQGVNARVDFAEHNTFAQQLATEAGLSLDFTTLRMILGDVTPTGLGPDYHGAASLAVG